MQRTLYLASRATGDARAAQQHRYVQHVAKRWYHRGFINLLRRGKLW
jgi:hypothetical protein